MISVFVYYALALSVASQAVSTEVRPSKFECMVNDHGTGNDILSGFTARDDLIEIICKKEVNLSSQFPGFCPSVLNYVDKNILQDDAPLMHMIASYYYTKNPPLDVKYDWYKPPGYTAYKAHQYNGCKSKYNCQTFKWMTYKKSVDLVKVMIESEKLLVEIKQHEFKLDTFKTFIAYFEELGEHFPDNQWRALQMSKYAAASCDGESDFIEKFKTIVASYRQKFNVNLSEAFKMWHDRKTA